jgi:hypothetical protein
MTKKQKAEIVSIKRKKKDGKVKDYRCVAVKEQKKKRKRKQQKNIPGKN